MQSGDILTDDTGASWVVDAKLGRGLWGRSWSLKGEDGTLAVLKVPHAAIDFPDSGTPDVLAEACATAARQLRELMSQERWSFLPALLGVVEQVDGRIGLVTPRYADSLESRLAGAAKLSDVIDVCERVLHRLATSTAAGAIHGNLRPTNVLLDPSGSPRLADPLVPALEAHRVALAAACPGRVTYTPPEARKEPRGTWDTWAIALAVWRSAHRVADPHTVELPVDGLGRVQLAALKDAAAERLQAERANSRFAGRATAKLGAVLNRALSAEHEPSPPYRFVRAAELKDRLVEVDELIHPSIDGTSRLMLGAAAAKGIFQHGDAVSFSINVGTTAGVTAQEDIAVGLQLRDLDATEGDGRIRVDNARFTIDRYPAGRWRFEFQLAAVDPGRYGVRVALAVKGAEGDPHVIEGSFEVRPRPGYVPPPVEEGTQPLPIPLRRLDGTPSEPRRSQPPRPIRPADESEVSPYTAPPSDAGPVTSPSSAGIVMPPPRPVHRDLGAPMAGFDRASPIAATTAGPSMRTAGGSAPGDARVAWSDDPEPPAHAGVALARASVPTAPPPPVPASLRVVPGGRDIGPPAVLEASLPTVASPEPDTVAAPDPDGYPEASYGAHDYGYGGSEDYGQDFGPPPVSVDPLAHDYPSGASAPGAALPAYDFDEPAARSPLTAVQQYLFGDTPPDPFSVLMAGLAAMIVLLMSAVALYGFLEALG